MRIINITDNLPADEAGNKLNEFVIRAGGCFLESWEWGEFQEKIGEKIWRIGVEDDNGALSAAATLIKKRLPFGKSYFYCPRGPIINYQLSIINYQLIFDFLFGEIKKIAESEKVIFLRFEPDTGNRKQETGNNIIKTLDIQPSKTLILDLSKSEEELLKAMREKTRYNMRLAEKKGVKIIEADAERFNDFWELMEETGGRDKFRLHGRNYYKAMLKITNGHELITNSHRCFIKLFFAEYEGKPIAAGIFSFFGDTATYLHGGSANEFRNVMAPYLLQWHIIKLAKNLGFKYYDFFGIDEKKWPGVTRFKRGFARLDSARQGGFEKNYPGTFDAVFDKGWYNIYKMARKIKRNV